MGQHRYWLAAVVTAICFHAVRAEAGPSAQAFAEDQLRLAETYLEAGDAWAAITPLLNVLRRPVRDAATQRRTHWNLARAYLSTGLYGSAERLLEDLTLSGAPWQGPALLELLRLRVLQQDAAGAQRALERVQKHDPDEVPVAARLGVARVALGAGQMDVACSIFDGLSAETESSEVAYFNGVCKLSRRDHAGARAQFLQVAAESSDADRALRERTALALARLAAADNRLSEARQWYGALSAGSALYDKALYELAWVHLAEDAVAEAGHSLLRLAIEQPLSDLVPRSQVLYGHILLEQSRFADAESRFAAYIAHYAAMDSRIAELEAIAQAPDVYDDLFKRLPTQFLDTRPQDIELLAWLDRNPRIQQARAVEAGMRTLEVHLGATARVLRDVQALTEGSYSSGSDGSIKELIEKQRIMHADLGELGSQFDKQVQSVGPRLSGRAGITFERTFTQLRAVRQLKAEFARTRQKSLERRQELVNLIPYIDADQWGIKSIDQARARAAPTEPSMAREKLETLFQALDQADARLEAGLVQAVAMEAEAIGVIVDTLATQIPEPQLRPLRRMTAQLEVLNSELVTIANLMHSRRRQGATLHRARVGDYLDRVHQLRGEFRRLEEEARMRRGEAVLAEAQQLRRLVHNLLIYAKLGMVDVAWQARAYALEQEHVLIARERIELTELRKAYEELDGQGLSRLEDVAEDSARAVHQAQLLTRRAASLAARHERTQAVLAKHWALGAHWEGRLAEARLSDETQTRQETARISLERAATDKPEGNVFGAIVFLDGRRISVGPEFHMPATYLRPGAHQLDILLVSAATEADAAARESHKRATLHMRLHAGRHYRIVVDFSAGAGEPVLRLAAGDPE